LGLQSPFCVVDRTRLPPFSTTSVNHLAIGLAHAMLAGAPELAAMRARCAQALKQDGDWLDELNQSCVDAHRHAWASISARRLAATIQTHDRFIQRLEQARSHDEAFAIRRMFLHHRQMGVPLGIKGELAVPELATSGDVCHWLALEPAGLDWFADTRGMNRKAANAALQHYLCKWIQKRSGGARLIEAPKQRLAQMQRRILRELLDYVPVHQAAHGFRPRHSILTHAQQHVGKAVVIRIDLQDFFASVHAGRIHALFAALGYPLEAARTLTGLCTHRTPGLILQTAPVSVAWASRQRLRAAHLPQGAPTSPALANLCAFGLDVRLESLARSFDADYSRYADDLVFSGGAHLARVATRLEPLVAAIAIDEGFRVNHRKTRVMRHAQRQCITGLVVNENLGVARQARDCLKALLHNCVKHGPSGQNHAGHADFRAHLLGLIAHVRMVNAAHGARLMARFERIDWAR
jgi:RNA-directed DNA polymerase